jgi:hypothetical protein
MRRAPSITTTATLFVLLALGACELDPAGVLEGPRYVWVPDTAQLEAPDMSDVGINAPGHAFAVAPPDRATEERNVVLFTDSTMRDTIGYAGSAALRATTPDGDPVRPGAAGSPPLRFEFGYAYGQVRTSARMAREAREGGARTRVGFVACASREPLDAWMAASARDDRSTTDSLLAGEECVVLRSGLPVAFIDSAAAGKAHVRVYAEEEAVDVWAPAEAVAPGR